ncbi:unnamed protein product [Penicillium olsonii]|nr:unnamed protein product [Penicillium olsonii]
MVKLSDDRPPQYEPHHQSHDNILITVIQNERRGRKWARKWDDFDPKAQNFFDTVPLGDSRCPPSVESFLHGARLLDEMADLFREAANMEEERNSHGQDELYDTVKKLSDTELDRVFASSNLGTGSDRQPELIWNHKSDIDGREKFKFKSSRARRFLHTVQGVWVHLTGPPV